MEETQKLILAEDVFDALDNGKLCTIRKGRRDIQLGELIFESLEENRIEIVNVLRVIYCKPFNVPIEYLKNDGFESALDMLDQMKRFYPDINVDTELTIVDFEIK